MSDRDPALRNISDTAAWAAFFRARETERRDALFRDPYAERLAGGRAEQIAATMPNATKDAWAWVTRTYLFDHFITQEVGQGADTVVNLAAGLDARPYRLALPAKLKWIEVDLPPLLAYKERVLQGDRPSCDLRRVPLDLSDAALRRDFFAGVGRQAKKALVITEGLLTYLTRDQVGALARDLWAQPSFERWLVDVASPGLREMMRKRVGGDLTRAGVSFEFAPEEGPAFFVAHGWRPIEVRSTLKTAARLGRPPVVLRLLALLPESQGRQGSRPWSAACLLQRAPA